MINITTCPEVGLSAISSKEANEMLSLGIIIEIDWFHSHRSAISSSSLSGELAACTFWSISPRNYIVLSLK
jgi:hypothetical protein